MEYLELSATQVSLAALLIVVNGAISVLLKLGLERSLALAATRSIVQLTLVGFVLKWVFNLNHWAIVLALGILMTLVASLTAANRNQQHAYRGLWVNTVISIWVSSWLVTGFALLVVLNGIKTWYQPQSQ